MRYVLIIGVTLVFASCLAFLAWRDEHHKVLDLQAQLALIRAPEPDRSRSISSVGSFSSDITEYQTIDLTGDLKVEKHDSIATAVPELFVSSGYVLAKCINVPEIKPNRTEVSHIASTLDKILAKLP